MIQSKGETLRCPWCNKEMVDSDSRVEDYVIPGRLGFSSRGGDEQCPECDEWFSVEYLGNDEYEVVQVEDHIDED